jgi:hypothetical protein
MKVRALLQKEIGVGERERERMMSFAICLLEEGGEGEESFRNLQVSEVVGERGVSFSRQKRENEGSGEVRGLATSINQHHHQLE